MVCGIPRFTLQCRMHRRGEGEPIPRVRKTSRTGRAECPIHLGLFLGPLTLENALATAHDSDWSCKALVRAQRLCDSPEKAHSRESQIRPATSKNRPGSLSREPDMFVTTILGGLDDGLLGEAGRYDAESLIQLVVGMTH